MIRRVTKFLTIGFLATFAGCVAATPIKSEKSEFERKVTRFLSWVVDESSNAPDFVGQVRSMEMVSGEMKAASFATFSGLEKSFRIESVNFYESEALLKMVGQMPVNGSCYDRLIVWLYSVGAKVDLKYMIESEGFCVTPVTSNPAPKSN